jgi:hypothetical protein
VGAWGGCRCLFANSPFSCWGSSSLNQSIKHAGHASTGGAGGRNGRLKHLQLFFPSLPSRSPASKQVQASLEKDGGKSPCLSLYKSSSRPAICPTCPPRRREGGGAGRGLNTKPTSFLFFFYPSSTNIYGSQFFWEEQYAAY